MADYVNKLLLAMNLFQRHWSLANHDWIQWKQNQQQTHSMPTVLTLCWGVIASTRPTKIRWDTSSSQAYANPGALAGRSMCNTLLQAHIVHTTLPTDTKILIQQEIWQWIMSDKSIGLYDGQDGMHNEPVAAYFHRV